MKVQIAKINEFSGIEYDQAFEMMDDARRNAVLRMKFQGDRQRSVLGEKLARKAISEATGMAEKEIRFARTEEGKPYCVNAEINFSISHCKDMVVCAVDENQIGIDVELIREIDMRITRFACTERDMEFVFGAESKAEQEERFFRLWTAKEAYVKFCGTGIKDLKTISFEDIRDRCETWTKGGYMITVYC